MTDLSPATQAVLTACNDAVERLPLSSTPEHFSIALIAAALRTAADQVAPSDADEPRYYLPMAFECRRIRKELLAIAAELEALDD